MKVKKSIGLLFVVSLCALLASSIILVNSGPVEDEPIGMMLPGGAGPVEDEPIGMMLPGGAGPVEDEPIGSHTVNAYVI